MTRRKIFILGFFASTTLIYLILIHSTGTFWKTSTYGADINTVFKRPFEYHAMRIKPREPSFPLHDLQTNDKNKLVNLTDFEFTIPNEEACSHDNVFLLVLVVSFSFHASQRQTIRSTWGQPADDTKILFLLGAVTDPLVQNDIDVESKHYGDIIQGNFLDTYTNLTYKSVMSLKYTVYYCPQATYILKVDDDSFVNMPLLNNFLKYDLSPFGMENLILCNDMTGSPAIRDKGTKWYVSEEEFPGSMYPSYCSGWYSIISPDVCFKLYKESQNTSYFRMEDVFLYGIVASKISDLKHSDISFYTLAYRNPELLFNGTYDSLSTLFGSPNMNENMIRKFWEYFRNKPVKESIYKYELGKLH